VVLKRSPTISVSRTNCSERLSRLPCPRQLSLSPPSHPFLRVRRERQRRERRETEERNGKRQTESESHTKRDRRHNHFSLTPSLSLVDEMQTKLEMNRDATNAQKAVQDMINAIRRVAEATGAKEIEAAQQEADVAIMGSEVRD
jgi:hypothetical protein